MTFVDESSYSVGGYKYDVNGLRVRKQVGGETTYFIYDGSVLLSEVMLDGPTLTGEWYYSFMPGSYYPLVMTVFDRATAVPYTIFKITVET